MKLFYYAHDRPNVGLSCFFGCLAQAGWFSPANDYMREPDEAAG